MSADEGIAHRAQRWAQARNILAVRLDQMGDVLMTTPALWAIRETLPQAHLTLLTSPGGARLAPHLPWIDEIIGAAVPWVKYPDDATVPALETLVESLRARAFDAAIIFTVFTQSALPAATLCTLLDIPLRLAHCRENPYRLLTDWSAETEPKHGVRHEVQRQLDLVEYVNYRGSTTHLRFEVPAAARRSVRGRLIRAGVDPDRTYIVVHPGASAPSRRYPAELFGMALRLLLARRDLTFVISGTTEEQSLVEPLLEHSGHGAKVVSLMGQLNLSELGALLDNAQLLIANNTGPVHLAAALRTPVVDLYALTNPQHTPWQTAARVLYHDVPCRFCMKSVCPEGHHACLKRVTPAEVADAAMALLESPQRGAIVPSQQVSVIS